MFVTQPGGETGLTPLLFDNRLDAEELAENWETDAAKGAVRVVTYESKD